MAAPLPAPAAGAPRPAGDQSLPISRSLDGAYASICGCETCGPLRHQIEVAKLERDLAALHAERAAIEQCSAAETKKIIRDETEARRDLKISGVRSWCVLAVFVFFSLASVALFLIALLGGPPGGVALYAAMQSAAPAAAGGSGFMLKGMLTRSAQLGTDGEPVAAADRSEPGA